MLELVQNSSNLIGSQKAIDDLAKKEHARILILSDSHGSCSRFISIIRNFGSTCDGLIFCGDGARDVAEILMCAAENPEFNACMPSVFAFVRGNGDSSIVPLTPEYAPSAQEFTKSRIIIPETQTLTVNQQTLFISHGHLFGVDYGYESFGLNAKLNGAKIAIHGHTHVPVCKNILNDDAKIEFTFINPGSISRPRGGSPASFAILTVEKNFTDTAFIKIKDSYGTSNSYETFTPVYF